MKKKLNDFPFWVQLIAIPIAWLIMVFKILLALPVYVIGKCNTVLNVKL